MKVIEFLKKLGKNIVGLFKGEKISVNINKQVVKGNFNQQAGRDIKNDR